ncbi:ABC transporter ATP-binding protein [Bacillus spongiae]|uniref:ABC transporter ATP-binding protein n=1 Tax=Bacillus spongiae TaxID=2683610 RepID=A0ABU8HBQ3_9BACI
MTTLLQMEDVSYWYRNGSQTQDILKKLTITFEKGKLYSIVGPSGSGKTTFLSLACGLDVPKEGSVLYEGSNIADIGLTKFRNRYVSIVFQAYNLLPYMTAIQNILTAMEITGSDVKNKKEFALETLAKVGISAEQAHQKVLTLSGGQQQRVSIARALCCQSDLIVADEPTGSVDAQTASDIIKIFQELAHKENKCIILVTHDSSIAAISDCTLRLSKGKLHVEEKSSERIY